MKKKFIIPLLIFGIITTSCKKLVDLKPQNSTTPEIALQDVNGYQALLISVYDRLQAFGYYGRDMVLLPDVMADNIVTNAANSGNRYVNNNTNVRSNHFNIWVNAYAGINELNTIIASIDNVSAINDQQKLLRQQIKSEAYTLRGLIYFDIARIYGYEPGTIPTTGTNAGFDKSAVIRLENTTSSEQADLRTRSTITETYAAIESSLTDGITNFKTLTTLPGYIKPTTPYRITESAAHALLGKVYLYERKYSNAVTEFDNALNATISFSRMITAGGYVAAFKTIPNPESIFELYFNQAIEFSGVTGSNDALYTYTQPSGTNDAKVTTFGGQTASAELVNLFEANDDRKAIFFTRASNVSATVLTWVNKYSGAAGAYTDDVPIIRYSDVMLMKAEALASQGQYVAAAEIVRTLRTNRNASTSIVPVTVAISNFIQDERRRELFFEGQRWFDLKRLGNGITKAAATGVGTIANTDYRILANLPPAEITLNRKLPDNPNY